MTLKVTPNLERARKEAGLTQVELAVKSGVPQAAISRFDKSAQGSYANLIALARALEIPVEALFTIDEVSDQ